MTQRNQSNLIQYHITTSRELIAIKDRVRYLIGGSNWGDEGRYKEAILRNMIGRFLPQPFITGQGFVVKETGIRTKEFICSKQIDIMIIDTSYPSLFKEGDFHIATPDSVRAIIEVKTNIQNQNLDAVIERMNKNAEFIEKGQTKKEPLFNGLFSFEGYNRKRNEANDRYEARIQRSLEDKIIAGFSDIEILRSSVNFCCVNENLFLRREPSQSQRLANAQSFAVYNLQGLAFSWFINNLLLYIRKLYRFENFDIYFPDDKQRWKLFEIPLREGTQDE